MKENTLRMFVCLFSIFFLRKLRSFFDLLWVEEGGWCVSKGATAYCATASVDHLQCCNPTRNITKLTKHPSSVRSTKSRIRSTRCDTDSLCDETTRPPIEARNENKSAGSSEIPSEPTWTHSLRLGFYEWKLKSPCEWMECCNCFLPPQRRRASSECKLAVFVLFSNARLSVNRRLLLPFSEIYLFEWAFHEWNGIFLLCGVRR